VVAVAVAVQYNHSFQNPDLSFPEVVAVAVPDLTEVRVALVEPTREYPHRGQVNPEVREHPLLVVQVVQVAPVLGVVVLAGVVEHLELPDNQALTPAVEVALPVLILWVSRLLRTQQRGLGKALHLN
jgi:hypothetical protein